MAGRKYVYYVDIGALSRDRVDDAMAQARKRVIDQCFLDTDDRLLIIPAHGFDRFEVIPDDRGIEKDFLIG